jgi:hypothetical protein
MRLLPLLAALSSLAVAGCTVTTAAPPASVTQCPTPPAPLAEVRPLPPVSNDELVWRFGHWEWNGTGYSWRPGEYITRAQSGGSTMWMAGYWAPDTTGRTCVWMPAHWVQ